MASAHLDLESRRCVGGFHWGPIDHAEFRRLPEQPPEIHGFVEVGYLGLVDAPLRYSLGKELELADCADEGEGDFADLGWGVLV